MKSIYYFRQAFILISVCLVWLTGCSQVHLRDTNYHYSKPNQLPDGILIGDLANPDIDSNKIIELTKHILKDTFPSIHSLLIAKDNKLIYENYFSGEDENWGSNTGYIEHGINDLHDIRSISKSVVAVCIGIAIQQHKIKSINDPVFNYLPDYAAYKTVRNETITIKDLLTMSSGIKWDENVPHGTSADNEIQMERSIDPGGICVKPANGYSTMKSLEL